ncbi:MAG: cytochrome c biogenesis protein ResB [Syntrophales bacterium]|nr:cytochrome c biogenesis protein ResB [Syntrophales bacterium]
MDKLKKNSIWSFFSSIRLAIILLIVITIVSILGTVIPQGEAAREFAGHLAPGWAFVFHKLQLFNIYRSVWFTILMILLSLNLVICSWNRFPTSWRLFRKALSSPPDWSHAFENLPPHRVLFSKRKTTEESVRLENLLKKKYRRVQLKDTGRATYLSGCKGVFSYFGVYIIHLSVLIIIGGVIIGVLLGFDAYVEIVEGGSSNTVQLRGKDGFKKLDFTVCCDRFSLDFYDNGTPKSYRSDLTFLKNNQVVYRGPVLVNHPVTFDGIRFYQANYGTMPGGEAVITVRKGNEEVSVFRAGAGAEFKLPGDDVTGKILRVEENLMGIGPAVKISIRSAEGDFQFWIFQYIEAIREKNPGLLEKAPLFNPGLFEPYLFSLSRIESRYYTGLQVNRDPGIPVVAAGSFSLILGFMIVFFCSHRQMWIKLESEGGGTRISITGKSNKDPVGLQRELSYFMGKVTREKG